MKAFFLSPSRALILGSLLILAGLVGSAQAQAPVFIPNQMTPVVGWAGGSNSSNYYGSPLASCATTTYLSGICTTQNAAFSTFSTIYYNSTFNGDKLPALQSQLFSPGGLATDPAGNLFWIDATLGLIRELNISTGIVSVIAGSTVGQTQCTTTTSGPAYTAASGACREYNSSTGDTAIATSASINDYTIPYTGLSVDSWDNVLWEDGTFHIRMVYGNQTNAAGQTNPMTAYIQSLYFSTYNATTGNVALGASYLSKALGGAQTAPITGYTYLLAGYYAGIAVPPSHFGGVPGLTNDSQPLTVTGTIAGTQFASGTAVTGQFPFLSQFQLMTAVTQDSSGNVYAADAANGVIRVINVQPTPITIAGTTIPAFSVGTIMGNTGSNCTFVVPNTNMSTAVCAGVTTASSNGNSAYAQIGATTIAPLGLPAQVPLQKVTSVFVDAPGNIYIGQTTDGAAKTDGLLVIYAGTNNAVTGSSNPLTNILSILYGASNVTKNVVYLLAGNGTNSRSATDQWGPSANGYSNVALTPGFSSGIFGIAVDSAGNVYFADGNHAFYRLDAASARIASIAGALTTSYAPPAGVAPYPNYTNASPTTPVACASIYQNNSVTETNTLESAISPFGDGCSTFATFLGEPTGVAVNANGDAFVVDTGLNVIHELLIGNTFGSALNPITTTTTQYVHLHFYGTDIPYESATGTSLGAGAFTVSGTGFSVGSFVCTLNSVIVDVTRSYDCYAGITYNPAVGPSSGIFYAEAADGAFASVPLTGYSLSPGLLASTTTLNTTLAIVPAENAVVNITVTGSGTTPTGTVTLTDTPTGGTTVTLLNAAPLTNGSVSYVGFLYAGNDRLVATYSGNLVYDSSASAPVNVTVATLNSLTSISSSSPNVIPGKTVNLSSTVSASSGTPAGTVTFYGTPTGGSQITLGTATLNASGVATYTWTAPLTPLGAFSVIASYNGQPSNYAVSSSNPTTITSAYLADTTSLAASVTSGVPLTPTTLTATIAGVAGTNPTGTVTFYITPSGGATTAIGNGNLASSGTANAIATYAWTLPSTPGTYSVTAVYNDDSNYISSTSSGVTFTDAYIPSTTLLSLSSPSGAPGGPITLTATVAGTTGTTPTKTVSFYSTLAGGAQTLIGTATVAASGTANAIATYNWTLPATIGSYTVIATYNGDGNYSPSTSTGMLENVTNLVGSKTALTALPATVVVGNSIALSAAVTASVTNSHTPGGTVNFIDGTSTLVTSGTLNASAVATGSGTLAVGQHTLTAVYSGDTIFVTSNSTGVPVTVTAATTTVTATSSVATSPFGQTITLSAKVAATGTPLIPGGTVTFTSGTTTLGSGTLDATGAVSVTTAALPVGSDTVTATYAATTNFVASSGTTAVTVSPLATSVAVTASPTTTAYGQSVSLSTRVTATGSTLIPGGTVNFTSGGVTLGTATLDPTGAATIATTLLSGGTDTITVSYVGTTSYLASSGTANVTVNPLATSVSLASSSASTTYGQAVTLTATATSTGSTVLPSGTVNFISGGTTLGSAALVAGVATFTTPALPAGADTVTATLVTNSNFTTSSASTNVTVATTTTTLVLTPGVTITVIGQSLTLSVKVTAAGANIPAGTVNFTSAGAALGSGVLDATGALTITTTALPIGADSISATYVGSANFVTSTASVTVNVTDFSFVETTQILNVLKGGTGTDVFTFSSVNNFTGTITVTCSTTTAATCTASPAQVTLTGLNTPVSTISIVAPTTTASNSFFRPFQMLGSIQVALLLFLFRRKKRWMTTIVLMLVSIAGFETLTGCGSTTLNSSQVTVTATSGASTHSQAIQFIVQ